MNVEELLAKVAQAALAAAKKTEAKPDPKPAVRDPNSPAVRRAAAEEKSKALLDAARAKHAKAGLDLVEEFMRDISPIVQRFMERERVDEDGKVTRDGDRLINNGMKLVVNFCRTDGASAPNFTILGGSGKTKTDRVIPAAIISQWSKSEEAFIEKFRREGGTLTVSSFHEALIEMTRLQKENSRLRSLLERAAKGYQDEADALDPETMPAGNTPSDPIVIVAETPVSTVSTLQ